jgi:heptosyltransferase-3
MALDPASVHRVLTFRLGSLGDTLVALPCYHLIARVFPNAERAILTNVPVSSKVPGPFELLAPSGLVHRQIRYTVGIRKPWELLELRRRIVEFAPDVLISINGIRSSTAVWRDACFFKSCGVRHLIGLPYSKSLRSCRVDGPDGSIETEASRLARCIAKLGDARLNEPASWSLNLTADERTRAAEALRPVAGRRLLSVSLGTKVQAKDWGEENWTNLLKALTVRYRDHGLVLVGAGAEGSLSERAAASWQGPTVNLCGLLSARETAAALAATELFIGHDSGPMHLAASVQVRCVAIFAARNIPRQWFPAGEGHRVIYHSVDCMGCGLEECIRERKKCLTSISVDEVEQAVVAALTQ